MSIDGNIDAVIFIIAGYIVIFCVFVWQRWLRPQFVFSNVTGPLAILHTLLSIGLVIGQ